MLHAQRFALDNIYCAPSQDKQFSFRMTRMNKTYLPPKQRITVHNATKHLPNALSSFHVFSIGGIPPQILNLLTQQEHWFKDSWIRASEDMVARNFILKVYNADGLVYPRAHLYYSFTDQNSLLVALEITDTLRSQMPVDSFTFLHLYSNAYFNTTAYHTLPVKRGIQYLSGVVNNNLEKVQFQSFVSANTVHGGDVFVYVNGHYVPAVTLSIPDGSSVEVVYDQSVRVREVFSVNDLRTFSSTLDGKMKYLLYRGDEQNFIQYQDDTEVYVTDVTAFVQRGLYFYKHNADVMRNVTDKDYSLNAPYLNNTCIRLGELTTPGMGTKRVVLYNRHSGRQMPLTYSALKLHELYKLPNDVQCDVINNTGYTLDLYRAENLENSNYFKVAGASKMMDITSQLATSAIGYAGLTYYYGETPQTLTGANANVPELYQWNSVGFEYDALGKYTGHYVTNGAMYSRALSTSAYVEFMKGSVPPNFGELLGHQDSFVLEDPTEELVFLSAYFSGSTKQSIWEDITFTPKLTRVGGAVSWLEDVGKKVKIVHMNALNIYDLDMPLTEGFIYFPITSTEDRGTGFQSFVADVPYLNISLYLNGNYLTQGIDYNIDFPNVCVFSKTYLNYGLPAQKLHIRCSGFTLDKTQINHLNVNGFVNNGVLTRNQRYDLREDRVYSVFVGGKLYDKNLVSFSEEDNTVRTQHAMNGLPYTVRENFIPVRFLSGVDSRPLYQMNNVANKKVSDLFNVAYPEPSINPFNVITTPHYLFSPVTSKIVNDMVSGVIPESVYSTPYNDNAILSLLASNYNHLLMMDPVKLVFPSTIVSIHPHLGNSVIAFNLLQYRFLQNVIRIITNNNPSKINLSGYISLSN